MSLSKKLMHYVGFVLSKIGGLIYISGISIFLYQLFIYISKGAWRRITVDYFIVHVIKMPWIYEVKWWAGISKSLVWMFIRIPFALFLFTIGIAFAAIGNNIDEKSGFDKFKKQ